MKDKNYLKKVISAVLSLAMIFGFATQAFAAGSYQLNENPNDSRFYSEAFTDGLTAGILRRTIIMAYLKAGETVYFGSNVAKSQQDINYKDTGKTTGNDISVIFPNGEIKSFDVKDDGQKEGFIANAIQEKNGPQLSGNTSSNYYNPLSFTAAEDGTYTFRFHSKDGAKGNPTERNTQAEFKTYNESVNQDSQVAAWDITVVGSDNKVKTGRTWANYLSLNTGSGTAKGSLHLYVVTTDRVIYKVDLNEISPWGFVFFANNSGFTTTDIVPKSVYHSFYDVTADLPNMQKMNLAIHLPNAVDSDSAKTYKLFFEYPSNDYLSTLEVPKTPKPITNIKFQGIDEFLTEVGSGGEFIFETEGASTAELILDFSAQLPSEYKGSGIVELNGPVKDGTNIFYWDGKDTAGVTLPAYNYDLDKISVKATPKLGEIHFPLIDVELIDGKGIVVERLTGGDLKDDNKYNLYYNNYPLYTGSLTSAAGVTTTASLSTGNKTVYTLSDGTMSYKYTDGSKGFNGIPANQIATLDENGELKPINSNETSMKFNMNGGNNSGIDIWTYYSPTNSTVTLGKDAGAEKHLSIIAPSTPMGSVGGRIFLDEDQNKKYNVDGGDKTLPNVEVELRSLGNAGEVFTRTEKINGIDKTITYSAFTDIHGAYHFYGVPEGEYIVKVNIPSDKAYENTTENDGNSDKHRQEIIVLKDKETIAEDIGYSVDKTAPVHFVFKKDWGTSNPIDNLKLRLFTVTTGGLAIPVAEEETPVLNYDNDWTYTFEGMHRDTDYFVEEYYTKEVGDEEVSILIGRSPIFNTDDGYWKTGFTYKADIASDEEKKANADEETRFYNLKFGFETKDFNHYYITLKNDQAFDNKEYYVQYENECVLKDFLSISGRNETVVKEIEKEKLIIRPKNGVMDAEFQVAANKKDIIFDELFGGAGTEEYEVIYDGVKFDLTIHIYKANTDEFEVSSAAIVAGTPVLLQTPLNSNTQWFKGIGTADPRGNIYGVLNNDVYRIVSSNGSTMRTSTQLAGVAFAGGEEVADPSTLIYHEPIHVDSEGAVISNHDATAVGTYGALTLSQTKTDKFITGEWDMAEYAKLAYSMHTPNPTEETEVYYYKLIVRSAAAKGIGFGLAGETYPASEATVMYVPIIINCDYPYTVTFNANGHGTAPESQLIAIGDKATKPADPTAEGYTFEGWYENAACTGEQFDFNSVVAGNETLYAKWTQNVYKVNFDTKGGNALSPVDVIHGNTVPAQSVSKTGYTLEGWVNAANNEEFIIGTTPVTGNLTLNAVWRANGDTPYKIEHYRQKLDGSYELAVTSDHKGKTDDTAVYIPHVYEGFTLDLSHADTESTGAIVADGSLVLKLYYTRNSYKVNYSYINATGLYGTPSAAPAEKFVSYGAVESVAANATLTGYDFSSWATADIAVAGGSFTMPAHDVSFTGSWTPKNYTVTWKNDNGTVLETKTLPYAATIPDYELATPTKPATAEYTYSFKEFTPDTSIVLGNTEFTATYTAAKNHYTVYFHAEGKALDPLHQTVAYGEKVTSPTVASHEYDFGGWYKDDACTIPFDFTTPITETITLHSKWTIKQFTVAFINYDHTVLNTRQVEYGVDLATFTDLPEPTKPSIESHNYGFAGWAPNLGPVTQNVTYEAIFVDSDRFYTVTWKNEDGTVIGTQSVKYGNVATFTDLGITPTKPSDGENDYVFIGWDTDDFTVRGDETYTAVFEAHPIKWGVTFKDEFNEVIYSYEIKHDEIPKYPDDQPKPTKQPTAKYEYVWKGWDPELKEEKLTTDTEFKATFDAFLRSYDVVWLNDDDTVIESSSAVYDTPITSISSPTATKQPTAEYTYTFAEWEGYHDTLTVNEPMVFKAKYNHTLNEYTIKWVVEGELKDT